MARSTPSSRCASTTASSPGCTPYAIPRSCRTWSARPPFAADSRRAGRRSVRAVAPSLGDGEDAPPGLAQGGGAVLEGGAFTGGHGRIEHLLDTAGAEHADQ